MAAPLPRSRYTSPPDDMNDAKFLLPQTDNDVWRDKFIERLAKNIEYIEKDIRNLRREMKEEFKSVRADMQREIKSIRAEIKDVSNEVKQHTH